MNVLNAGNRKASLRNSSRSVPQLMARFKPTPFAAAIHRPSQDHAAHRQRAVTSSADCCAFPGALEERRLPQVRSLLHLGKSGLGHWYIAGDSWRMPVLRPFSRLKTAARSPTVVPGIRGLHCFQRGTPSALSSRSFGVAVFSPGHAVGQEKSIVIASTTSTQDSGLFDYHSLPSTNGSFGIQ